ncbi:LysR family transcriptional regulator ArgP [bacterium]|nr:LysR family transcriptional regulator ArgP [bacterium]
MLDYKLLEALAVVVQEGGFDKAARSLNLTQSAVSQRIKQLEEQTGQIVIARTTPPKATPAGQQMIKHYLQVKRLEDDLFDAVIPSDSKEYATLAIGTNRDCLTTWLQTAVQGFLRKKRVVLEFRAADQEQTHQLMKDGEVIGCISVKKQPMQGCLIEPLGQMKYWMVANPEFAKRWFKKGITEDTVHKAPLILFDRRDEMHTKFFDQIIKDLPLNLPVHFVPSTKTYTDFIISGLAYGLLPEQECGPFLSSGELTNLAPDTPVNIDLYWHCWNLRSQLLEDFTRELVLNARSLLLQGHP